MSDTSQSSSLFPAGESAGRSSTDPEVQNLESKLANLKIVDAATLQNLKDISDAKTLLHELEDAGSLTTFQSEMIQSGVIEDIRFDDYVLLDKLGEGGMGAVYKARSTALDRIEAIKMMTRMEDPNVRRRFQREAKILARLEHPAIVPIYRIGRAGDTDYIAMKFVEGEDLKSKVDKANERGELLPIDQVCRWIQRTADALAHAHEQGIIHRDIKPHNLMITDTGECVVLDMGIGRLASAANGEVTAGMTVEGSVMGTPDYMPPEQWADSRSVTPAADIYALGCTLFFALTGKVPYPRERLHEIMRAHAIDPIPYAHQLRPEIPIGLDKVIARMLEKDPEDRFASAADVVKALQPYTRPLQDDVVTVDMRTESGSTSRNRRTADVAPESNKGAVIAAVCLFFVLLGAIGGVAFFVLKPIPDEPAVVANDGEDPQQDPDVSNDAEPAEPEAKVDAEPVANVPPPQTEPIPDWVKEYQTKHNKDWPTLDELVQFVKTNAGTASLQNAVYFVDASGPLTMQTSQRRRQRIQSAAKAWLEEIRTKNADLWVTANELDELVDAIRPVESLDTDEEYAHFQAALTTELQHWRHPFDSLNVDIFGPGYTARIAETLKQLLAVYTLPKEENWQIIAGFENGQTENVTQAKVGEKVYFWFTITEPCYVTMVNLNEHDLFVFPIDQVWEPGNAIALTQAAGLSFDEPGEKVFIAFATDKIPVGLEKSLYTLDWKTDVQKPLAKLFPSEHTFHHVRRCLENRKPIPGVEPKYAKHWAQTLIRLTVVK